MAKFLDLCEEYDPQNTEDDKWTLIDYLKSKGVNVSLIRNTNMLYIDTDTKTVAVTVSMPDEDAESINAGVGKYEVDKEVEGLASKASSGLSGIAGQVFGTSAQKAKSALKKRQQLAKKAVDVYDKGTQRLEQGLRSASSTRPIRTSY